MIFIWIIVSILIFSIIVIIHELWHFSTARFFWVRVEEFGLWIPPRAKKLFKDKKGTLFSLNWFPLWGFVKLTWESPSTFYVFDKKWAIYNNIDLEKDLKKDIQIFDKEWKEIWKTSKVQILKKLQENSADYNLSNKPAWQQAIIILAWVFMNFLLATLIFSILFFVWVKPIWVNTKIDTDRDIKIIPNYQQALESGLLIKNPWIILYPEEWSIAMQAWITDWDILISINGEKINSIEETIDIVKSNALKEIELILIDSESLKINIQITPSLGGKIWSYLSENVTINKDFEYNYSLMDSIKYWVIETYNQSMLTFQGLWILIKKIFNPETKEERSEAIKQVSWPIWIVDFITNSMSAWFIFILILSAIISINLWVFNLLPIPALDWWRFIFITLNWIIEKLFWKKAINANIENLIHVLFFIFLIALSLLIAYNDIMKLLS